MKTVIRMTSYLQNVDGEVHAQICASIFQEVTKLVIEVSTDTHVREHTM